MQTDKTSRQIRIVGELSEGLNVSLDPNKAGMIASDLINTLGPGYERYIPVLEKIVKRGRAIREDTNQLNKLYDEYHDRGR